MFKVLYYINKVCSYIFNLLCNHVNYITPYRVL